MNWNCVGAVKPKNVNMVFCTPVFIANENGTVCAQRLTHDDFLSDMLIVSKMYLEHMELVQHPEEKNICIGQEGLFGFSLSEGHLFIGTRQELDEFIFERLDIVKKEPIAHLSVLRFLGCPPDVEKVAINAVGSLIENPEIRLAFIELEMVGVLASEEHRLLDSLIEELTLSSSFATTHAIIARIMGLRGHFATRHYRQAIRASLSNNQVYWISGDADVKEFLDFTTHRGNLRLSSDAMAKLSD